jgi:hypothetical protein
MIFSTENSNKFQKTRFWKVEDVVTLGPMAHATLVYIYTLREIVDKKIRN